LALHANEQTPAAHVTLLVLAGAPQELPQLPQLAVLVLRLISQPFAGFPSQFANPALQPVTWQTPALHADVAFARLHFVPHALQLFGSELKTTQEPRQFVSPAWQLTAQPPDEHTSPIGQT
jgi:hypothetical protein